MAMLRNEKLIKGVGQRVRAERLSQGLTMEGLADLAGIDYRQIARVELGTANTTISTAYQIARALEVPFSQLFDFDPESVE
jgi:transcriptional regulator with XRE-family HTH domain